MYAVPPLHNTHELCRWFAGDTGEYRQRVRTALLQAQAAPAADDTTTTTTDKDDGALRNFTQRRSNSNTTTTPAATAQRTRELLCALAQAQMLPSMAQLRRPGHAAAMAAAAVLCDVVATADVPLALLAATHLTAASVLATHASRALHRQLSSNNNSNNNNSSNSNKDTRSYDDADVDACRVVCCVAARELVAQPAPTHGQRRGLLRSLLQVHTQATYDALDEEQKVQQQVQQLQQQQQQQQQQQAQQQQQRVRPLQFGAVCDTCVPHTEAYYDVYAQTFVLSGAGKFAVVGAACADVALVTATLYTADESYNNNAKKNNSSSNDTKRKTTTTNNNDGTQRSSDGPVIVPHVCVFAVQLRERGGALCAGVRIEPLVGEHTLYEAAGVALLHLHNVAVPVHCLLRPHRVTRHGVLTMDAEGDDGNGEDSGGDVNNKTKKSNNSSTSAARMHDTLRAAAQYVTRRTHAMTMSLMSAASSSSSAQQQLLPALPVREEDVARHATTALHTRARLLAAGVCAGVLTTLMTSVTRFAARRHVAGYTGVQHDYLYMSLQHVQHQVTTAVAYGVVALLAWQQRDVHEDTAAPPVTRDSNSNNNDNNDDAKSDDGMLLCCTYSERLRIACVLCALQEAVVRMSRVAHACMGVHASFASSGVDTAMAALHVLQDSIDQAQLLHDIAAASSLSSASGHRTRNTSPHSSLSPLSRLLRHLVPLRADNSKTTTTTTTKSSSSSSHTVYTTRQQRRYEHRQSPLLAAEWRQLAEEHTHAISALHAAMTSAEQHTAHVNHAEAVWHAWWTLHARDVHVCGAARVDMHLVRSVDWVQAQCRDVYVRQLLCDVVLVYTAARQAERMACDMPWTTTTSSSLWTLLPPSVSALLSALRRRRAVRAAYEEHEEAVARVAGHCVALVDALAVPPSAWAPCALSSRVWRAYWSIPGTLSEDEVAAAECERRGEAKQWRRQHPQPRPRDVRSRDDDEDDDNSSSSSSRAADDEDDEVDEALRNPLYDDMLHGLADDKATTTAATRHARLTERTARN